VLFLDEPTTGLDPESRAAMWQEIARLAAIDGMTVLLTTHYLEEADRLASRLAIVDRGRVVASGTPDNLKGELRGDVVRVELPPKRTTASSATCSRACPMCGMWSSRGAFTLPLMFLSSAFMQTSLMPGWMQAIASRNPLNWVVQIGRSAVSARPDWGAIGVRFGGLLVLAVACVAVSVVTFRSYQKNV